jgi:hypothetical protein
MIASVSFGAMKNVQASGLALSRPGTIRARATSMN